MVLSKGLNKLFVYLSLVLVGCASNVYEYDPNERVELGIIVSKESPSDKELQRMEEGIDNASWANAASMYGVMGVVAHEAGIGLPTDIDDYQTPFTNYIVVTSSKKKYLVKDRYSGFNINDCVKIFISEDSTKYPLRIARGFDCANSQ